MAGFDEVEAPRALKINLRILSDLHPYTPLGWDEVTQYISQLKFVDKSLGITQQILVRQYGLTYVGARSALKLAKDLVESEILDAQDCVIHRDNGGCPDRVCTQECFVGLNTQRFLFSQALVLCLNFFDLESTEFNA